MKKIIMVILMTTALFAQTKYGEINKEIENGNFSIAVTKINEMLGNKDLSETERWELNFEKDRMERIKIDFRKTKDDITTFLKKYYPAVTDSMLDKWEKEKSLEAKNIDSQKVYFNNAGPNLFRIDKEAHAQKVKVDGADKDKLDEFLAAHIPAIVEKTRPDMRLANPVRIKLTYTLTVDTNAVPDGEIVRCWLPYPQETHARQADVRLMSTVPERNIIAPKDQMQRTIYLEKKAEKGKPTVFSMELAYTCYSEWFNIDTAKVKEYDKNTDLYKKYTSENAPHIVFSEDIKALSERIVGAEKNPYKIVKKVFEWINDSIPWASSREYSTMRNIPAYVLENKHGDCGMKSLLFITLMRYNGIPAKWQSGWMMHPVAVNLHDWSEVYFEGLGWVPVDQSFGIQNSTDPRVKYFYTNGIDAYRLIVNDDYSQPLYPAKIYPRSETVDFQRGEVEWRGGNVYFNKWNYNMQAEYSDMQSNGTKVK